MSDWKPLTDDDLDDYETRDSREEFLKTSLIEARAALAAGGQPPSDGMPSEARRVIAYLGRFRWGTAMSDADVERVYNDFLKHERGVSAPPSQEAGKP